MSGLPGRAPRPCLHCGKVKLMIYKGAKRGWQKFCDRSCSRQYTMAHPEEYVKPESPKGPIRTLLEEYAGDMHLDVSEWAAGRLG